MTELTSAPLTIGSTFPTNNYGDVVILDKHTGYFFTIQFAMTGHVQKSHGTYIQKGCVRDKSVINSNHSTVKYVEGAILPSKNCGEFEILRRDGDWMDIKFINTGSVVRANRTSVGNGRIHDPELKRVKPVREYFPGRIYPTQNHGLITILENNGRDGIKVEFVDTGSITTTSATSIRKGMVRDPANTKVYSPITQEARLKRIHIKVGDTFVNTQGYAFEIVEVVDSKNVTVRFKDSGSVRKSCCSQIKKGCVKDYFQPSVIGGGYIGNSDGKTDKVIHQTWMGMLHRVAKDKSYTDCSVDPRWLSYANFAEDIKKFPFFEDYYASAGTKEWSLDKDLKVPGNRVYGPEHCTFMRSSDNSLEAALRAHKFGNSLTSHIGDAALALLRAEYGLGKIVGNSR